MESIWLCTGCKSFRGTRDKDFIGFDKNKTYIKLVFYDKIRKQEITFSVLKDNLKDKRIYLNGVGIPLLSKLFGSLKCVIFTPEDLDITKGSPENRRIFLDISISQIKKAYISAKIKYDSILNQRNALLKEIYFGRSNSSMIEIWDEQIAEAGAYISVLRNTYTRKLNDYAGKMYNLLTDGKENLAIAYHSTVFKKIDDRIDYKGDMKKEYADKLKKNLDDDIKSGYTQIGIHRDEVILKINDLNIRDFGSQGQQRSAALVLKLSQAKILYNETGELPVILLDDVLSELDPLRQSFIMNNIEDMQLFITCCNPADVLKYKIGNVYFMENGSIIDIIYNN